MIWLYTIIITIGAIATVINVQSIINLWHRNSAKRKLFDTYKAKNYLLNSKEKSKAHEQFQKDYDALGGNYEIEVKNRLDNIFKKYNLRG